MVFPDHNTTEHNPAHLQPHPGRCDRRIFGISLDLSQKELKVSAAVSCASPGLGPMLFPQRMFNLATALAKLLSQSSVLRCLGTSPSFSSLNGPWTSIRRVLDLDTNVCHGLLTQMPAMDCLSQMSVMECVSHKT